MKYFAKHIPVEGEIKEGDYYTWKGIATKGQWVITKYTGANPFPIEIDENHKKVKLFLCSRDIQVGDIIDCTYQVMDLDFRKVGEIIQTDELGDHAFTIKSDGGKTKQWIPKEYAYKVIGEISPDATWVKDGDELEEENIMTYIMGDNYYMGVAIKNPKTGEWT